MATNVKATPERHLDDLFMTEGLYTVPLLGSRVVLHVNDRLRQSSGQEKVGGIEVLFQVEEKERGRGYPPSHSYSLLKKWNKSYSLEGILMEAPKIQSSSSCCAQLRLTPYPPTLFCLRTMTRTLPSDLQQQSQGKSRSNNTRFARFPTIRRLEHYNASNSTTPPTIRISHNNGTTQHAPLDSPPLSIPPQPSPSTIPSTFTLFPKLALELRDMIWKYAASEPRTVRLFIIDGTLGTTNPSQTLKVSGQSKHPGIVHACSESREAALEIYEKCSVTVISNVDGLLDRDTIYVNFAVDRFLSQVSKAPTVDHCGFGAHNFTFNFTPGHVKQIQNLQMETRASEDRGLWMKKTLWNLLERSNIASVWFINSDWARNYSMIPTFEAARLLEENYWQECCVMEILKEAGLLLPELEFHWKATAETALWPCAPIDNYNPSAGKPGYNCFLEGGLLRTTKAES